MRISREELPEFMRDVKRVLNKQGAKIEEETPVEEAPAKKTKKVEKTEPEEVEVDEKDNDPLYAKVVETVADMSNEEIAQEAGVSEKTIRRAKKGV